MLKQITAVVVLLVLTASCNMWKKPASGWSGATGGEQLEKLFWDDIKAKAWKSVDQHVASTFLGSSGSGPQDRQKFMAVLHSYALTSVSLRDCAANLNGDTVVIACVVQREGSQTGPWATASTVSAWQQLKKGWIMVSHAENPIVAAKD